MKPELEDKSLILYSPQVADLDETHQFSEMLTSEYECFHVFYTSFPTMRVPCWQDNNDMYNVNSLLLYRLSFKGEMAPLFLKRLLDAVHNKK